MFRGPRDGFPGAGEVPEGRDRPVRQGRPSGHTAMLSGADRAVFGAPRDQAPPETRDGPEDMEHGLSGGGCRVDPFPGADRVDLSGPEAVDGPMEFPGRAVRAVGADDGGGVVGPGPVERGRWTGPSRRLRPSRIPGCRPCVSWCLQNGRFRARSDVAALGQDQGGESVFLSVSIIPNVFKPTTFRGLFMGRRLLSSRTPRMLGWERIILSGDFDWHSDASGRKIARPLNTRPVRDRGA